MTEQLTLGGVAVADAYVDLTGASAGQLYVIVEEPMSTSDWFPIGDDPRLVEHDAVFRGWQESLPVSEETGRGWSPSEIETDDGTLERYESLDHIVTRRQNTEESRSCAKVSVKRSVKSTVGTFPVRVERIHAILERYVNGEAGSDTINYWLARRQQDGWSSPKDGDARFEDEEIRLVADGIYTWLAKPDSKIDDDAEVYEP